jgi:phosphoglycolate phosphatase-like HAD superfamily hydrolase
MECKALERRPLIISFRTILFDLDGTLTDSKEGIINSYLNAVNKMGHKETERESILEYIGQPLHVFPGKAQAGK